MFHSASLASTALVLSTICAMALEAPALPTTAKKLTGKDIVALYDGSTVKFNNFTKDKPLTGSVTYDLKTKSAAGNYVYGGSASANFSQRIRINGSKFCYQVGKDKETCVTVHTDGANIYETDATGTVTSLNQKQ
jgi:hypothetical protein